MSFKASSSDLLVLVYVLGVTGIAINMFAYYKKVNQYNGRVLDDKGELVSIQKFLNSDGGKSLIRYTINVEIRDKLNFVMYNRKYYIMNTDSTKMLQVDGKMSPEKYQKWKFVKA